MAKISFVGAYISKGAIPKIQKTDRMVKNLHDKRRVPTKGAGTSFYAQKYGLKPADRIKEPIFQTGFSKHHSIYLGIDESGHEWVAENHKLHGVRLVRADVFFKEGQNYRIERFTGNQADRIAAVKRALGVLGKPYDLILFNCEHYSSYVQTGKAESQQVNVAIAALAGLILIFLLQPKIKN